MFTIEALTLIALGISKCSWEDPISTTFLPYQCQAPLIRLLRSISLVVGCMHWTTFGVTMVVFCAMGCDYNYYMLFYVLRFVNRDSFLGYRLEDAHMQLIVNAKWLKLQKLWTFEVEITNVM